MTLPQNLRRQDTVRLFGFSPTQFVEGGGANRQAAIGGQGILRFDIQQIQRGGRKQLRHLQGVRIVQKTTRGIHLHQVAGVHDRHTMTQHERLVLIVSHVQAGETVTLVQAHNIGSDARAHLLVNAGQGLVKKNHGSTTDKGSGNAHALGLTARQLRRLAVLQALKLQGCQQLAVIVHIDLTGKSMQTRGEENIILHAQMRVQNGTLKHHTHRAALQRLTAVGHPTRRGVLQAGNNAKKR